ncbi:hypothetical protein ACWGH3_26235 [Streptomyces sp. NPDC054884]|uniref:hypothetical protein n=1 Tax=Streptomyces sp. ME08-AFT2 TaxID=3028683 RepID=UPI0029B66839|nr:hypothetical protein [Streptomyces sp. ME08-AFT2]
MPRPGALLCALAAAAALLPATPAQAAAPETQALHFDAAPTPCRGPTAPDRVECGRISVPFEWVDRGAMGGLFGSRGADPVPVGPAAERACLASLRNTADDCAAGAGADRAVYRSRDFRATARCAPVISPEIIELHHDKRPRRM